MFDEREHPRTRHQGWPWTQWTVAVGTDNQPLRFVTREIATADQQRLPRRLARWFLRCQHVDVQHQVHQIP